jgi:hypothetical protein
MLASMRRGHLLRRWRHSVTEFVEIPGVEEGGCFDDLRVPHLKIPGISIVKGFSIRDRGCGIEQDDDRIAISVDSADVGTSGVDMWALNGLITLSRNSFLPR